MFMVCTRNLVLPARKGAHDDNELWPWNDGTLTPIQPAAAGKCALQLGGEVPVLRIRPVRVAA